MFPVYPQPSEEGTIDWTGSAVAFLATWSVLAFILLFDGGWH